METSNEKGKNTSKTVENATSKITTVFRGFKTLFGVAAILLSFWAAILTAFLIRSSIFILLYADVYKQDTFTIEKLVFVKGKYTGSRAQRSYDKHWAEGTVAGRTENFSLGGYTQGTINSQEDLESQFEIGQKLPVVYNPDVPEDLDMKSANDGMLGSRGAMLFEPYSDRSDYRGHYQGYNSDSDRPGSLVGNPEVYYNYCKDAVEHGYCVDSHAIGDRGISEVIDVLERIHEDVLNMNILMTIVDGNIVFER